MTKKLGELLVAEGMVDQMQVELAAGIQEKLAEYKPIGKILVDMKALTEKQLNFVLDHYFKRPLLGQVLIRSGAISQEQLEIGLRQQQEWKLPLGEVLIKLGYLEETAMRKAISTQLDVPLLNLDKATLDNSLVTVMSEGYARKNLVVPLSRKGGAITIAMDDPTNFRLAEELSYFTGQKINVATAVRAAIERAIDRLYQNKDQQGLNEYPELDLRTVDEAPAAVGAQQTEAPPDKKVDSLIQLIIGTALGNRASDIHFESLDRQMLIRYRIDGILREANLPDLQNDINRRSKELISKVKILGKLDIAEKRRPQDGSFRTRVVEGEETRKIDIRISVVPGYFGENAVLRILDPNNAPRSIDELGFCTEILDSMHSLLERTTGIMLVTGPTGSGKSTTLYGALMTVFKPGIKILTAEDPIEYVYNGITQCEVNEKINNTFANYTRAFLRQDPDIILIGEIRDAETAEMAFRAAQTGHLVLSTMHTNDAVSTITRLLGLGIEPSLINACLAGVLAQRLTRKICPVCKEEYQPSEKTLTELFRTLTPGMKHYQGRKCPECNFRGYKGRFAIGELWVPSETDMLLISKNASFDEIRESSRNSTVPMATDALAKLRAGMTNPDELLRMLPFSSIHDLRRTMSGVFRLGEGIIADEPAASGNLGQYPA
ncbi:MAG: hypothetical protein AUK55_09870 [Syntrophobacteraceae bacterium CG2_30_61_12]|nr:MAG: hypothetical protein AUK55_09870 [Syntrophobacteraceae bacterium CG2_30_61_12]